MANNLKNYILGFKGFIFNSIYRSLIITVLTFSVLATVFYLYSNKISENVIYKQSLFREQVIAHTGANVLENFFEDISNQIIVYASSDGVVKMDDSSKKYLEEFVSIWSEDGPVDGAYILDKNGNVVAGTDIVDEIVTDTNLKLTDYFKHLNGVTDKRKVFISKPTTSFLGTNNEYEVIIVASPIVKNNNFNGILMLSISINKLAEKYLLPLKLSEHHRIYLINNDGIIIYSPDEKLIGVNIVNFVKKSNVREANKISDLYMKNLNDNADTSFDAYLPQPNETGFKMVRYLSADSPIKIGDQTLSLSSSVPANFELVFLTPLRNTIIAVFAFCLSVIICFAASNLKIIKTYTKINDK